LEHSADQPHEIIGLKVDPFAFDRLPDALLAWNAVLNGF
jgi:hypothetical protein